MLYEYYIGVFEKNTMWILQNSIAILADCKKESVSSDWHVP